MQPTVSISRWIAVGRGVVLWAGVRRDCSATGARGPQGSKRVYGVLDQYPPIEVSKDGADQMRGGDRSGTRAVAVGVRCQAVLTGTELRGVGPEQQNVAAEKKKNGRRIAAAERWESAKWHVLGLQACAGSGEHLGSGETGVGRPGCRRRACTVALSARPRRRRTEQKRLLGAHCR